MSKLKDRLDIRIDPVIKSEFISKANDMGKTAGHFVREFIVAFNEGRLKIDDEKQLNQAKELYHVNRD